VLVSVGGDEPVQMPPRLGCGFRPAGEKALHDHRTYADERFQLLAGLDSLGDDTEAQLGSEGDNSGYGFQSAGTGDEAVDKGFIALTGSICNRLRDEYPVPKSSIEISTPILRSWFSR
jgi:hypothetical protein